MKFTDYVVAGIGFTFGVAIATFALKMVGAKVLGA